MNPRYIKKKNVIANTSFETFGSDEMVTLCENEHVHPVAHLQDFRVKILLNNYLTFSFWKYNSTICRPSYITILNFANTSAKQVVFNSFVNT